MPRCTHSWNCLLLLLSFSLVFCTDTHEGAQKLDAGVHQQANFLHDSQQIHNKEHIMEHLDGVMKKKEEDMTPEELQFHYFKLHDYDNNNMLDGIELIKAMTHFDGHDESRAERMPDSELSSLVDSVLRQDDLNGDGYVDQSKIKEKSWVLRPNTIIFINLYILDCYILRRLGYDVFDSHEADHSHDKASGQPASKEHKKPHIWSDEELSSEVEAVLESADLDNNGYIDYSEFLRETRRIEMEEELRRRVQEMKQRNFASNNPKSPKASSAVPPKHGL